MPGYYDEIDLSFNWAGDFDLSGGDLKDTSSDGLQSMLDQIHSVCASSFNDWEIYPRRAAGLSDFIGEPNTRSTANRITDRLTISLISSGIVSQDDLNIRVIPVHAHRVLVVLRVSALPTPFNQLLDGQVLQTTLVFDTVEQHVFFLDKTPNLIGG